MKNKKTFSRLKNYYSVQRYSFTKSHSLSM